MKKTLHFEEDFTVTARPDVLFDVMSDLRTYARWGALTYLSCETEGPPKVGQVVKVCVKGPLPFRIRFDLTVAALEAPTAITLTAAGDIDGEWKMRFEPQGPRVTIHSDWQFAPRKAPPAFIAPLLKPVFRWNHTSSTKRAYQGLQPYLDREHERRVQ
jgi:hypothetical protein